MVLQQIFSEKNIILNLTSEDKDELFEEMIQNIVDNNIKKPSFTAICKLLQMGTQL